METDASGDYFIRHAVEEGPAAVVITDREGRICWVNAAFTRLTGYAREEAIGQTLRLLKSGKQDQAFYQNLWKTILSGQTWHGELINKAKNGTLYVDEQMISPVRNSDGEITHFIAIKNNVTLKKQAEDALREAEGALENALEGIARADSAGRYIAVNNAFANMAGYEPWELLGRMWTATVHPYDIEGFLGAYIRMKQEGRGEFEGRAIKKDQTMFFQRLVLVAAKDSENKYAGCYICLQDITQRKKTEEELRHAKRMAEDSSRAKSAFLANMSHELRTPLNSIIGAADILSELNAIDETEYRKWARIISNAGSSLLSIINDILDLAKIESGQVNFESVPFNLRETVAAAVEVMGVKASLKSLDLTWGIDPDVPNALIGAQPQLRQILMNILGNAIKFTPKGRIDLRVRRDPNAPGPGALIFSIADTGIGIAEDKLQTIFENFAQADPQIGRQYGGAGLGLAICKHLAELMGGRIWVESRPEIGSTFYVNLPFKLHSAPPAAGLSTALEEKGAPGATARPLKVLLAEDSENSRNLISTFLKSLPVEIQTAVDGPSAVELFKSHPSEFDLVIMDIRLPGLDGYAAMRAIREIETLQSQKPVPILALTALAFQDDVDRCLAAGCNKHLAKPVRKLSLLKAVKELTFSRAGRNDS